MLCRLFRPHRFGLHTGHIDDELSGFRRIRASLLLDIPLRG